MVKMKVVKLLKKPWIWITTTLWSLLSYKRAIISYCKTSTNLLMNCLLYSSCFQLKQNIFLSFFSGKAFSSIDMYSIQTAVKGKAAKL